MIGIASPILCFSPFDEVLADVSKHFRLWEVLVEGEHRLDLIGGAITDAMDTLDMRFQIHAAMSDVNIGSIHEPMRAFAVKEIASTVEACRRMNVPLVTVHPGFIGGIAFLDKGRVVEQTKRSLVELARTAEEHSVEIAVENMPRGINATCTEAPELVEVAEAAGLGLCFDLGHANTAGQVDALLRNAGSFKNVHLHNNNGSWDQHNAIDDGTADVAAAVSTIVKSGYRGNYIIESTDLSSGVKSKDVLLGLLDDPSTA